MVEMSDLSKGLAVLILEISDLSKGLAVLMLKIVTCLNV